MNRKQRKTQPNASRVVDSPNSGAYDPGPIKERENDFPNAELWQVQSHIYDLAIEEFPEGPYGAAQDEPYLGKVSEWKPGQAVSGRFRDSNMIRSDRQVATEEEPFTESPGTTEGQN